MSVITPAVEVARLDAAHVCVSRRNRAPHRPSQLPGVDRRAVRNRLALAELAFITAAPAPKSAGLDTAAEATARADARPVGVCISRHRDNRAWRWSERVISEASVGVITPAARSAVLKSTAMS